MQQVTSTFIFILSFLFPHILGNNLHYDAFAKQEKVFTFYPFTNNATLEVSL